MAQQNLAAASAQLGVAVDCDPMLYSVDGIDSRCDWAVDRQVNRQEGVAVPINLCKLIEG
jgi:hypothetical protein